MALVYVGGMSAQRAGSGSQGLSLDLTTISGGVGSIQAGDLVIVCIGQGHTADLSVGMATPAGSPAWVEREDYSNGTSYDSNSILAYRFHQSGDPTTYVTDPSGSTAAGMSASVHVWRGVDAVTPMDVTPPTIAKGTGTGRPTPPAITPSTAGAIILCGGTGAAATGANYTASQLSNFQTNNGADNVDGMSGLGSYAWSSGTFTPSQWTGGTTNAGDSWVGHTIALRPAVEVVDKTLAETGSGTDAATIDGAVDLADTGSGSDAMAVSEQAEKALTETGSGSDAMEVGSQEEKALADSGAGADDMAVAQTEEKALAETGSGADSAAVDAALSLEDSGSGADAMATEGATALADSGTGEDVAAVDAALTLEDSGSGADAMTADGAVDLADSGSGEDAMSSEAAVALADSGSGADAMEIDASGGTLEKSMTESGSGADGATIAGEDALSDSGIGVDSAAIDAFLDLMESGVGADSMSVEETIGPLMADAGSGEDAAEISANVGLADSGSGIDVLTIMVSLGMTETGSGADGMTKTSQGGGVARRRRTQCRDEG